MYPRSVVTKAPLGPRAPPREAVALCVAARVRLTEGRCRPGVSLGIDLASVRRVSFRRPLFLAQAPSAGSSKALLFLRARAVAGSRLAYSGQRSAPQPAVLSSHVCFRRAEPTTTRGMAQPQTVKGFLPLRWCPPQPRRGTATLSGDSLLPAVNRLPCTAPHPRPWRTPFGEPPSSKNYP